MFRDFDFKTYLKEEILQSSRRRHEEDNAQEQSCGPFRNRVYKFLSIPQYFESFMFYGLLQCLDHLLMVYTFLPLRCAIAFFSCILSAARSLFGPWAACVRPTARFKVYATDARELVKFSFVCICTVFLYTFDSSIAYHEIRTQSVIKIYIFFNLLEVADRLLSAVYLDAIDDVLFTVSAGLAGVRRPVRNPSGGSADCSTTAAPSVEAGGFGAFVAQYLFALVCVSAHCLLLLAQVTTLNVAFNSQNRSLLTVMISNNFVELKGNVFRKMGKSNLFQIACADVRERFHYSVWLFIIVCRNMSASGWQYEDFLVLLPDILLILLAEVAVDWVKHAFISKFNVIASDVYEEYTVSLAYDLLLCRQGKNTSDYFELLARRMGLTPISLSCLINVMIIQTVKSSWIYIFLLLLLPLLFAIKVSVHIILLNLAFYHVHAYTQMMIAKLAKEETSSTSKGAPCPPSNPPATAFGPSSASRVVGASGVSAASTTTNTLTKSETSVSTTVRRRETPLGAGNGLRRSMSIFYSPYTGYDQPTRDEGQLAMPQLAQMLLLHRRTHSDSSFLASVPFLTKDVSVTLAKSSSVSVNSQTVAEDEKFCSFSSLASEQLHLQPQKGLLKSFDNGEMFDVVTDAKFRQFLCDADDMQVRHRKPFILPSLPSSPSRTATAEPPFKLSPRSPSFRRSTRQGFFFPPRQGPSMTSSQKTSPQKRQVGRRCVSLETLPLPGSPESQHLDRQSTNTNPPTPSIPLDGTWSVVPTTHSPIKRISVLRRRLHTENEVSSLRILEQLNSILNDESAHLEGAVDVDLLSDDEMNEHRQQQNSNGVQLEGLDGECVDGRESGEEGAGVPSSGAQSTAATATLGAMAMPGITATEPGITGDSVLDQVKQPLSNVDRYSMLGGQIS